jgi:hypothetical protein
MKRLLSVLYFFSWLIAAHSFAGSATSKLDPVDNNGTKKRGSHQKKGVRAKY